MERDLRTYSTHDPDEVKHAAEGAPAGCVSRRTSRSADAYLRLKSVRQDGQPVAGMFSNTGFRYGTRTTPTTRRTSHDDPSRNLY